jgi:cell division protein FtsI (penicillin-binding protein 3)
MEATARKGTGTRALLGDVSIGVKTGTAQMLDEKKGGYSKEDFISNCVAVFPIENPQIILYIVITKAKGETYAGRIVAPVIAEAANTIIDYMGMSREGADSIEHDGIINIAPARSVKIDNVVPDFIGYSKKELLPLLNQHKVNVKINGSGWVTSQNPIPGTPVTENMVIELNLE